MIIVFFSENDSQRVTCLRACSWQIFFHTFLKPSVALSCCETPFCKNYAKLDRLGKRERNSLRMPQKYLVRLDCEKVKIKFKFSDLAGLEFFTKAEVSKYRNKFWSYNGTSFSYLVLNVTNSTLIWAIKVDILKS